MAKKTDLDERTDDPMPDAIALLPRRSTRTGRKVPRKEATSIRMRLSGAS